MKGSLSTNTFRYTSFAQQVIFGPDTVRELPEALAQLGWTRILLCTSPSMQRNGHAAAIEAALGECLVATFDGVRPHVQDVQVEEATALAERQQVDSIVALGGGSPIGMAKAVSHALEQKRGGAEAAPSPVAEPLVPIAAIPTTYAGSEMTAVYGVTHSRETPARKITVSDPRVAPRLVIYDPKLTVDLPADLTASSGINALAHCIEALYSVTRHPSSSAIAVGGVVLIQHALLRCHRDGQDLEARAQMQSGAHLAGLALASTSMGLHHGLCHVLGGSANVPHGIANAIMLPHAMRFNADETARELLPAAEALGVLVNGNHPVAAVEEAAQRVSDMIRQTKLPQRLRDVGVQKSDLPRLAELGFQNRTVQKNIKRIQDRGQIQAVLEAAW